MPDASNIARRCQPLPVRQAAMGVLLLLSLAACSGDSASSRVEVAATDAVAMLPPTSQPIASGDSGADLCLSIAGVEQRLTSLQAVELRLPNRVALDIELTQLQSAFAELRQADLGTFEAQLESPLTRLGYRLAELELAVEDFHTNSRPARAAPHVEEDAETFAAELAAFAILARC